MTKDEIDVMLRRKIGDGSQFDSYIDKPQNQDVSLGIGDTLHGVGMMKKWILASYKQVAKLAAILKSDDLQKTCLNIKRFMFFNIQYSMDERLQKLRSPANSWQNRATGIDCKSYSIFAACVLRNLGIKFYIRRIKQANLRKNKFSHVYVIVPLDQTTGSLDKGHIVIDGTMRSNQEAKFTAKEDLYMDDQLPYVGMNAAAKKPAARKAKAKTSTRKPKAPAAKKATKYFPFK